MALRGSTTRDYGQVFFEERTTQYLLQVVSDSVKVVDGQRQENGYAWLHIGQLSQGPWSVLFPIEAHRAKA
jgi:hypothetical protein